MEDPIRRGPATIFHRPPGGDWNVLARPARLPGMFTLRVWYHATPEDGEPQTHHDLTDEQVEQGAIAFLSDLLHLKGEGVRKLEVEFTPGDAAPSDG